ncbi:MAG: glycogen/starch synthase [Desulfobacterales bacterium]
MSVSSAEERSERVAPRILVVTPEVAFLPAGMGAGAEAVSVRAGTPADLVAALIRVLDEMGADVHVAVPNYRNLFRSRGAAAVGGSVARIGPIPRERVHLAQDRAFFYPTRLQAIPGFETVKISLAFQREVLNRIIPEVRPDVVHCFDWMTGLIPAMTRELGLPCLYTLTSLNTARLTLAAIEDRGIDAAAFWRNCYYGRMPAGYEETRESNPADILVSAVFAAHFVNTPGRAFLAELLAGGCPGVDPVLVAELAAKGRAGCLAAVDHAPDPSFDPALDGALYRRFQAEDHAVAKPFNKLHLQERLGLPLDSKAPLFFWPTRLDGDRAGCRLALEAIGPLMKRFAADGLQLVFVADGDLHDVLRKIAADCGAQDRLAAAGFDPRLQRLAFGAADGVLLPIQVSPCGLCCRIAQRYGALPVGYDAGGIRDAVTHLDAGANKGNGFVFRHFDRTGLMWAVGEAMTFFALAPAVRTRQVKRIMAEARAGPDAFDTARHYIDLYGRMLNRPMTHLIKTPVEAEEARSAA